MATLFPADTGSTQVTWPWCGGKLTRTLCDHRRALGIDAIKLDTLAADLAAEIQHRDQH